MLFRRIVDERAHITRPIFTCERNCVASSSVKDIDSFKTGEKDRRVCIVLKLLQQTWENHLTSNLYTVYAHDIGC